MTTQYHNGTPIRHDKASYLVELVCAICDCIKDAGCEGFPAGHLYNALMCKVPGFQMRHFEQFKQLLLDSGKVKYLNHCFVWNG